MGLSIHYRGKFDFRTSLSEMIEEVQGVAEVYKWDYQIFEVQFPENFSETGNVNDKLYGISVFPEKCEPVYFAFLSNGDIGSLIKLKYYEQMRKEGKLSSWVSTKTQYAGIHVHKVLIHLYRYISEKYFSEFEMTDESQYWETGDEKLMEEVFNRYNYIMDQVALGLETIPMKEEETFEEYFQNLMKIIRNKGL